MSVCVCVCVCGCVLGCTQFPIVLGNSVANIGPHLLFQVDQPLLFPLTHSPLWSHNLCFSCTETLNSLWLSLCIYCSLCLKHQDTRSSARWTTHPSGRPSSKIAPTLGGERVAPFCGLICTPLFVKLYWNSLLRYISSQEHHEEFRGISHVLYLLLHPNDLSGRDYAHNKYALEWEV